MAVIELMPKIPPCWTVPVRRQTSKGTIDVSVENSRMYSYSNFKPPVVTETVSPFHLYDPSTFIFSGLSSVNVYYASHQARMFTISCWNAHLSLSMLVAEMALHSCLMYFGAEIYSSPRLHPRTANPNSSSGSSSA